MTGTCQQTWMRSTSAAWAKPRRTIFARYSTDAVSIQIREDVDGCSCQPILDAIRDVVLADPDLAVAAALVFPGVDLSNANNQLSECCEGGTADNPTFNKCIADLLSTGFFPTSMEEEASTSTSEGTIATATTGATDAPPTPSPLHSAGSITSSLLPLTITVVMPMLTHVAVM